jgi:NitT/TauT family transport system substrate-binding protein
MPDRRDFLRTAGLTGLAMAAGGALAACGSSGGSSSGSGSKKKLTVVKYGEPAAASSVFFAWYPIAHKLGYFEAEGVDGQLVTNATPTPLVQAGQIPTCVSAGSEFLPFVAANPSTDIIITWTQVPKPYYWIVVPANSPIQDFSQLKGKKIGAIGPGSSTWWVIDAMCAAYGMDVNKDIKKATVPAGAALVQAFKSGQIDAGSYVDAQVIQADEQLGSDPKAPLRLLPVPTSLAKQGGAVNLMKRSTLEANMDLYVGYMRALAKAFVFINANIKAGLSIHLDAFPALQQASESRDQCLSRLANELQPRLDESKKPDWSTEDHPWGWTYEENLSVWAPVLPTLKGKNIDMSKLYTNDLVNAAYNFDVAAVQQAANNYKLS